MNYLTLTNLPNENSSLVWMRLYPTLRNLKIHLLGNVEVCVRSGEPTVYIELALPVFPVQLSLLGPGGGNMGRD